MEWLNDLILKIIAYEKERGEHRSGSIAEPVLQTLGELAPTPLNTSLETGCGKTTILLSRLSKRHWVYTVDDSAIAESSVPFVRECPHFNRHRAKFVFGPTQQTLPRKPPRSSLDLAVLDGPHGYPFPELEYFHIYPALRPGALLVVDDIHIPTVGRLYDFLREDAMFEPITVVHTTAFLRRTGAPTFPRTGDDWQNQNFNSTRFDWEYHPS